MGDVRTNWTADTDKAIANLQRLVNKQSEQIEKLRDGKQASDSMNDSFGDLGNRLAGWVSAGTLIAGATQALREFDAVAKAGVERFKEEEASRKASAQVGVTQQFADTLSRELGLTGDQAQQLGFTATSAGFSERDTLTIGRAVEPVVSDPKALFDTVLKLRRQFGAESGAPLEALNAIFAAAQESPVSFEQIAPQVARAAASVKTIGGTQEELLSAGALAAQAEEPSIAVTQIRAFADFIKKYRPDLVGLGLSGATRALLDEGSIQEITLDIPETRAASGFNILAQNIQDLEASTRRIERARAAAGTEESPLSEARRRAGEDPVLVARGLGRRAASELEIAERENALREDFQQTILTIARSELERQFRGQTGFGSVIERGIARTRLNLLDITHPDPLETAGGAIYTLFGGAETGPVLSRRGVTEEDRNKVIDRFQSVLQKFDESIDRLRRDSLSITSTNE